jgi:hypothetical protein
MKAKAIGARSLGIPLSDGRSSTSSPFAAFWALNWRGIHVFRCAGDSLGADGPILRTGPGVAHIFVWNRLVSEGVCHLDREPEELVHTKHQAGAEPFNKMSD